MGTTRERVDSRGFDYGAAFSATTEAGHWVDYVFLNPALGVDQLKHTWIIRHDGLLFGSGWYEDAPDESRSAADGGAVILGVTDEGRWLDYFFRNLATGQDEMKHA